MQGELTGWKEKRIQSALKMTLYHTAMVNPQIPICANGAVPRMRFIRRGWLGRWLADPGGPSKGAVWSISSSAEVRGRSSSEWKREFCEVMSYVKEEYGGLWDAGSTTRGGRRVLRNTSLLWLCSVGVDRVNFHMPLRLVWLAVGCGPTVWSAEQNSSQLPWQAQTDNDNTRHRCYWEFARLSQTWT
jgi:hypothetical protein